MSGLFRRWSFPREEEEAAVGNGQTEHLEANLDIESLNDGDDEEAFPSSLSSASSTVISQDTVITTADRRYVIPGQLASSSQQQQIPLYSAESGYVLTRTPSMASLFSTQTGGWGRRDSVGTLSPSNSFMMLSSPLLLMNNNDDSQQQATPRRPAKLSSRASLLASIGSNSSKNLDLSRVSIVSVTSTRQRCIILGLTIAAIIFRILAVLMVTSQSCAWILMTVKGKTLELAKHVVQKGYLPDVMMDFYRADAHLMFALTVAGSIVIPILRISIVLFCFLYPLHERYHETRTRVLFIMDHVGRFILIDVFVMGYMTVFSYRSVSLLPPALIDVASSAAVPVDDVRLVVTSELFPTFYTGLLSNLIGTFLTHYMLLMSVPTTPLSIKESEERQTLVNRLPEHFGPSSFWSLLIALMTASASLSYLTLASPSIISFRATGAMGEFPAPSEPVLFDIWTIFSRLPRTVYYDPDGKGLSFAGANLLALVYVSVVVVIPAMLIGLCIATLFLPMRKIVQREILFTSPFWFSWCAVDLFLVITVSQYFEMGPMSAFMTEQLFPALCRHIKLNLEVECSGVESKIHPDGFIPLLVLGIALIYIRVKFIGLFHVMNDSETRQRLPVIL